MLVYSIRTYQYIMKDHRTHLAIARLLRAALIIYLLFIAFNALSQQTGRDKVAAYAGVGLYFNLTHTEADQYLLSTDSRLMLGCGTYDSYLKLELENGDILQLINVAGPDCGEVPLCIFHITNQDLEKLQAHEVVSIYYYLQRGQKYKVKDSTWLQRNIKVIEDAKH